MRNHNPRRGQSRRVQTSKNVVVSKRNNPKLFKWNGIQRAYPYEKRAPPSPPVEKTHNNRKTRLRRLI